MTIIPTAVDAMWGTDMTAAVTAEHGQAAVFVAVDHCSAECVAIHTAPSGTRHEALEPIRQGVRERFGAVGGPESAAVLAIRHDHGTQYMSRDYQTEIRWLVAASSPTFVRAPEGNSLILHPAGRGRPKRRHAPSAPRPRVDNAMVKALARASWLRRMHDAGLVEAIRQALAESPFTASATPSHL